MSFDFYINRGIIAASDNAEEESMPICDFPSLKKCLTDMGIQIGHAGAWRSVGTVDVLPEDIGKRILFKNNGIFYIDDDGVKRRGFMYKTAFYFEYKGRKKRPKFHVCKCTAIENFGRDAYRFANAEPVKVYSRNACKEVEVKGMELCDYCRNMLMNEEAKRVSNSTGFVEILKETGDVEKPAEYNVDIFGYVKNWEEISLNYRIKRNFTCERCGTHVEDGFDRSFMQTHHKNGIKTDNQEGNLECLCIKCHSEADDTHRRNFSSEAQKVVIDEYMRKYHPLAELKSEAEQVSSTFPRQGVAVAAGSGLFGQVVTPEQFAQEVESYNSSLDE